MKNPNLFVNRVAWIRKTSRNLIFYLKFEGIVKFFYNSIAEWNEIEAQHFSDISFSKINNFDSNVSKIITRRKETN